MKKNCSTDGFNPTQPDHRGLGWVELYMMSWVRLNLFKRFGSKNLLNPTHTPLHDSSILKAWFELNI